MRGKTLEFVNNQLDMKIKDLVMTDSKEDLIRDSLKNHLSDQMKDLTREGKKRNQLKEGLSTTMIEHPKEMKLFQEESSIITLEGKVEKKEEASEEVLEEH